MKLQHMYVYIKIGSTHVDRKQQATSIHITVFNSPKQWLSLKQLLLDSNCGDAQRHLMAQQKSLE